MEDENKILIFTCVFINKNLVVNEAKASFPPSPARSRLGV